MRVLEMGGQWFVLELEGGFFYKVYAVCTSEIAAQAALRLMSL